MGTTLAHVAPKAPTTVVHGQLGWLNIQCSRLLRVAGLGTLRHACSVFFSPQTSVAARTAHITSTSSHSFVSHMGTTLVNIGIAPPSCWGLRTGMPISVVHRLLRHVEEWWCVVTPTPPIMQPCSQVRRSVHVLKGNRCLTSMQSFTAGICPLLLPGIGDWARRGHHCFGDGRSASMSILCSCTFFFFFFLASGTT